MRRIYEGCVREGGGCMREVVRGRNERKGCQR